MVKSYHFIGIGGSGMSALAQFRCMEGLPVTGSDRLLDNGKKYPVLEKLEALGARLFPQDGSGVTADTQAVVASTAIEDGNPDIAQAKKQGIPVIHRSEMLAGYVARYRTAVISGTSGKSTVTAMAYEILARAGKSPSVITGAGLIALEEQGLVGNAYRGNGDMLVIEGDESDGTLVRYRPALGVVLNLDKDHKELDELRDIFTAFGNNAEHLICNGDRPELCRLLPGADTFGTGKGCGVRGTGIGLLGDGSRFRVGTVPFELPVPGAHNVENALAAVAACLYLGATPEEAADGLRQFQGVTRRFQRIGEARGVTVVDDFAHNPAKIEAALLAAQLNAKRVLAVFQPHGYGPTRFLKNELVAAFTSTLRPDDRLYMPEIYYAGGTATRDISSKDITDAVTDGGKNAVFAGTRDELLPLLAADARAGDMILVMGARDPGLPEYCWEILEALQYDSGE